MIFFINVTLFQDQLSKQNEQLDLNLMEVTEKKVSLAIDFWNALM